MDNIVSRRPRVVIMLDGGYSTHVELLNGILRFSQTHAPWITDIRMGRPGEDSTLDISKEPVDGLIASSHFTEILRSVRKRKIPVVVEDAPPKISGVIAALSCDNAAVTRLALEHLEGRGFVHYAFVPEPSEQPWSRTRQRAFRETLRRRPGVTIHIFDRNTSTLPQWLTGLPRPIGVMAADDIRARQVADAIHAIGARIPDDFAIIGVDNDRILCETTTPALSSIRLEKQEAGFRAAAALHAVMTGSRRFPAKPMKIIYGGTLVARQSTRPAVSANPLASRCCELLELNLRSSFSINDLLPHLNVSRRTLETNFKAATGHTIHAELVTMRINRAKALLHDSGYSQEQIAELCGFHDASHLSVVFRRELNRLPSDFRPPRKSG